MVSDGEKTQDEDEPLFYEVFQCPRTQFEPCRRLVLGCESDHNKFIPVDKFDMDHLPKDIRNEEVFSIVELNIHLAVKVCVQKQDHLGTTAQETRVQLEGNDTHGSGSICYFSDTHDMFPCNHIKADPCLRCHIPGCPYTGIMGDDHFMVTSQEIGSENIQWERAHLAFRVSTNQHVVGDNTNAKNATVELFYDSENRENVVTAQVVCIGEVWEEQDKVHLVCVSDMNARVHYLLQTMRHEMNRLFSAIPDEIKQRFIDNYVIVVSHPHGGPKVVSVGMKDNCTTKCCNNGKYYIETRYQVVTCRGCSGAPVIGPGWEHGGPGYRVHCGTVQQSKTRNKIGLSKSFWIVDSNARGGAGQTFFELMKETCSVKSFFKLVFLFFCLIHIHIRRFCFQRN